MITRGRRRLAWLALVAAVLLGAYSWAGVAMASSFAVASSEQASGHRVAAFIYLGILVASLIVAIAAVTILWRARRSSGEAAP